MPVRSLFTFALLAIVGACSGGDNLTGVAMPANGILVSLTVPGQCIVGGCDPISADLNHLGLVTLTNTGSEKAYVPLCGPLPAIGTQQYINGTWVNVGPAVSCVFGPMSMVIAPHDSVRFNAFYGAGIWRLTVGAATDTTLFSEGLSISAPVTIK